MNENIQLEMNPSVKKQRSIATSIALFSQDVDNYSFDIMFTDLELQAGDEVEVLAKLQGGKLEYKSSATLVEVDGKLIARYVFDTKLIDGEGHVFCYVYLKRDDKSADVGAFYFEVDLSELDKVGGKIAEVYDGRYEDLVAGFEIRLQEYRDSLPQASEVRAEVDVILNQFGVDSQAKLNQYDTDAQQVIADNQTAFDLAEDNRQDAYEQAEDNRNQSSSQTLADWEQDADALLETVEGNESARVDAEAIRKSNETTRVGAEIARKSAEASREVSEDSRQANESTRIADENIRKANEIQRNDKQIRLNNEVVNGDFSQDTTNWTSNGSLTVNEGVATFITNVLSLYSLIEANLTIEKNHKYYVQHLQKDNPYTWYYRTTPSNTIYHENDDISDGVKSAVFTATSNDTGFIFRVRNAREETPVNVDNFLVINLTETFGAGNEPSKEEMDRLIEITGYIDEEYALNNKEMLIWTLALIRRNKNAIIALGGA